MGSPPTQIATPPAPMAPPASDPASDPARALIARYHALTAASRAQRQRHGAVLADSRAAAGAKGRLADSRYPIVATAGQGAWITDLDGRRLIDLAMGFGVQLFGHDAPFLRQALLDQLGRSGVLLGPQSDLAGAVAARLVDLTGHDRACLCNSGTEAVMTALRLARLATGREGMAMFTWSYHGHYDGTLGRPGPVADGVRRTVPLDGGVSRALMGQLMMLDYGSDQALTRIEAAGPGLAAVLVEPIQSLKLELQPRAFLARLRQLTRRLGIVLIFDEVLTGFRLALGGAQALFGVRADLATYGKILGGGLPIGAVAGDAALMAGIDGGAAAGGAPQTFFAGTFNKNPLAMAAADAVLRRLQAAGPDLQRDLNCTTAVFLERLGAGLRALGSPLTTASAGSLFRFRGPGDLSLFHMALTVEGVYTWEGRSCFLSTAHTPAVLQDLLERILKAAALYQAVLARD